MAMLEVKNLEVYYGVICALKGISFEVNEGEIVSLIGANGAGKTTMMQSVVGLIPKRSGTVIFDGQDITKTAIADVSANSRVCPTTNHRTNVHNEISITIGTKTPATLSAKRAIGAFDPPASSTRRITFASVVSSPIFSV
jgi:ABC-type branched-subunit amino acid transport system ATPase component